MRLKLGSADERVTALFVLASFRSSIGLLVTLVFTGLTYMCLGINGMTGVDAARIAAGVCGMVAVAVRLCFGSADTKASWWTAMAGYWTPDNTLDWIRVPPGDLRKDR